MTAAYFAVYALDKPGRRAAREGARERADVERFVAADPYSAADVFERVEIRAWRWGLGAPLDATAV